MKMNYRRNHNPYKYIYIAGSIVVLVLLFVFWGDAITRGVSSGLHTISTPFWKGGSKTQQTANSFFSLLQSKQALVQENEDLKEQIQQYDAQKIITEALRTENERLKSLLDRSGGRDAVGAVILSRPPQSPYDTMVIDVGRDKQVEKGDRVYAYGDIPIGEIVSTKKSSSIVELFSTQGRITEVSIGPNSISGSAEGRGGQNFVITLPRDVSVNEGDVISAPDIGVSVLGVVSSIDKDTSSPFQQIFFTSPVHIQNLSWVTVSRSARVEHDTIEE